MTERIDEKDLPLTNAAPTDELRAVRAGKSVRVPIGSLPASAAVQEQIDTLVAGQAAGQRVYRTWSELSGVTGSVGEGAQVIDDTGTHTDPVSGATVSNAGQYRWTGSVWEWLRGDVLASKADKREVSAVVGGIEYAGSVADASVNLAGTSVAGVILAANGTLSANSAWRASDYVPVTRSSIVTSNATVAPTTTTAATYAFYAADYSYLGSVNPDFDGIGAVVRVADHYPLARFVRVSSPTTNDLAVYVSGGDVAAVPTGAELSALLAVEDGFIDASAGYINTSGAFVSASAWRATPMIDVVPGQLIEYSGTSNANSGLMYPVAMYDASGSYIGPLLRGRNGAGMVTITSELRIPAGCYGIRATALAANAFGLAYRVAKSGGGDNSKSTAFVPTAVYAVATESVYIFPRSLFPDASYDLAFDVPGFNERSCKFTAAAAGSTTAGMRAIGPDGKSALVASFPILAAPAALVNPASARNVICLGDSTTDGVSNSGVSGAWPNEASRRLSGVGYELTPGALSPAPKALSNVIFRGTRGTNAVKHEGRPGWSAQNYLTAASVSGVTNAFWNPGTSQFDLDYYLSTNGFDLTGDPTNGVNATGSNLTVIIQLGWNDVYTTDLATSVSRLSSLIDRLKAGRSAVDIVVLGLHPAPLLNTKTTFAAGSRWVSRRAVWELAVKEYGEAYRSLCASKSNCTFLAVAPTFDAETGYVAAAEAVSGRSSATYTPTADHVHPNANGYAYIADTVYNYLAYKYCSG